MNFFLFKIEKDKDDNIIPPKPHENNFWERNKLVIILCGILLLILILFVFLLIMYKRKKNKIKMLTEEF